MKGLPALASDPRTSRRALCLGLLVLLLASGVRAQSPPGRLPPGSAAGQGGGGTVVSPEPLPSRGLGDALFAEIQLRDLPSSRTIWSLIETADALTIVDRIDNGGLYLGEPLLMGSVGSSWTQTGFTFDGLDLTDPERTGTPLAYPDPATLRTVQVAGAFPGVELAGGGPTVALLPRAPAKRFGGSLDLSYLPNQFQAAPDPAAAPPIAHFGSAGDGSLLLSGPLTPAAGMLVSGRRAQSRRFERDDPTPLDGRLSSLFVHALSNASQAGRFSFVGGLESTSHPFAGRLHFPDRGGTARDSYLHLQGTWEHASGAGRTWSLATGFASGTLGRPDEVPSPTVGVIERLRDGPVAETMLASSGTRQRWQAMLRARPTAGGRHDVDLGASLARTQSEIEAMPRAIVGELVDGLPARAWDYTYAGDSMLRHATEMAAWVNDRITLGSRVALEGGVRFDSTRATARDNPTSINWQSVLPRAMLRVGLTRTGSASFYTGYELRRHRLPLGYLAYGDTSAPSAQVYRWLDANHDRQLQLSELGTRIAFAGPGPRAGYAPGLDSNLQAPYTRDFVVGFDFTLGQHWRTRLFGVERHQRRLVASVNEGVTASDYTVRALPDRGNDFFNPVDDRELLVYDRNPASFGKDRMVLTNPDGHDGHQIGGEFVLERLFDGRWHMLLGFSAQRSDAYAGNPGFLVTENDPGVIGELFENPNALSYARGRLFFERGYIAKWSGGFATGHGLHVAAVARYQDGQHFARMVVVPDLNQGPEAIQAYTRGHSRFTFSFTLDARAEQRLRSGSGGVALFVEAFNLLNNAIEVEEDPVVTRTFRATTAVQPPRAVRVGLRVDF